MIKNKITTGRSDLLNGDPARFRGDYMKKEDPKLQGLCKECTHRNSCPDAKRHLNMIDCSKYKHWKKKTNVKVQRCKMTNEQKLEKLKGFKKYLTNGNPIWDVEECAEVFDYAIACIEAWDKVFHEANERYITFIPSNFEEGETYEGAFHDGMGCVMDIINKHLKEV